MNQRVELLVNIGTTAEPIWTNIDLTENIPFPITYKIADIKQPDKRNVSFSKTITVLGTKNNNYLLTNIFKIEKQAQSTVINFSPDFNPNLKAECIVKQDTQEIFRGVLKLEKIKINNQNDIIYDLTIYNSLANIFDSWGEKELPDIDLSEYEHEWNYANVVNSRGYQIKQGGVPVAFQFGNGYVYPHIDYGYSTKVTTKVVDGVNQIIKTQDGKYYKVTNFFPAIYVYTILKKMFEGEGFTWNSSILDSTLFKHLIIPFSNPLEYIKPTADQQALRSFQAVVPNDYIAGANNDFILGFANETNDPGDVHSYSGGSKYTIPVSGRYNIQSQVGYKYSFLFPPIPPDYWMIGLIRVSLNYRIRKNGTINLKEDTVVVDLPVTDPLVNQIISEDFVFKTAVSNYYLKKDDYIEILITYFAISDIYYFHIIGGYDSYNVLPNPFDTTILSGSTFEGKYNATQLSEGEIFPMNKVLPKGIKQRDFFMSLVKMFNLYIEQDKDNEKILKIETRDDFYTNESEDWTDKLDLSKPVEIIPMGELEGKKYLFTYKSDKDYFNKKYFDKWNEVYGQKQTNVNNDFIKDTKKTEVIFSPTPSVQYPSSGTRVYPQIIELDKDNNIKNTSGNIRILYYAGLLPTSLWFINRLVAEGISVSEVQLFYAFAGHVDDPFEPSLDLSFEKPKEIYWTAGNILNNYTNNNLFNKYYSKFISEITDKNSKILRAWFYLKSNDLSKLSFKRKYFIDGNYYILNSINDADITKSDSVECEFLLLKNAEVFIPETIIIPGGENDQQTYPILIRGGINFNMPAQQTAFYNVINGGVDSVAGNGIINLIDANN